MNPIKRIALILTVIFLLPALFFSVYEISSLSKDEKMIEGIYQKQLEAILFSVNQYSDNALNGWISKVESGYESKAENGALPAPLQILLANPAIQMAFVVDSIDQKYTIKVFALDSLLADSLRPSIDKGLQENTSQIQQLIRYKKSGFQKAETVQSGWKSNENFQLIIFIIESSSRSTQVAGLIINLELFIEDLIGPRLQIISKDQFILAAFNKKRNTTVYSTQYGDTTSIHSSVLTKDLWIFPDYSLGIRTQGASLKQIVRERTNTNLILLVGLDVVLIVALLLAFRSVKREVQLAQNKSDFVANVSHEIRTPLALISMFAETLEMGRAPSEEKRQEYYSIISKETHRLSGIVNKILNFSQTEAGKKKLRLEEVQLAKEINEILKTYDFHLKNKGFEYHFEEGTELRVKADKEALTEIIINLIDNAIKYSADKKRIEISLSIESGLGVIAIKDFGLGISKADQKHIFDKFYRVSSGNLAKSQGTGLGLSLVKQLIEQQNGKISVTSELGQGSVFMVSLPLI
jgi:two-component system, OmpR family, phosphate regulon sensor histidine kinase PhoR